MTPRSPRMRDVIVAILVGFVGPTVLGVVLHLVHVRLGPATRVLVGDALPALSAAVLVTMWGWWHRIGWRPPVWRRIWLLWLPLWLLGLAMINAAPRLREMTASRAVPAAAAALLIGFTEETWFRGVLIEGLRSRGAGVAAFGSAVVFAAVHLANIRALGLASVLTQSLGALAIGLMFGAVRLRIESLWPLVLIHAAFDFPYLAGAAPQPRPISGEGVRVLVFLIAVSVVYGLVITRKSKTQDVSEVVPTLG